MTDRGYLNLLSHLTRAQTTLPLPTIQASIAHYLAHIRPSPTPLAATVVSSPLFRYASYAKLDGIVIAFRHTVHIKVKALKDEPSGLFTQSIRSQLESWIAEILKGLQGGQSLLRLSCYVGLLQGLGDWEKELKLKESRTRGRVEAELVVALAEVMDQLNMTSSNGWEKEFSHESHPQSEEGVLQLTCLIAARGLSLTAPARLKALPLASLTRLVLSVLAEAFQSGTFLRGLIPDGSSEPSFQNHGASNIHALSKSLLLAHMASLSAMCSQLLSILADARPTEAWPVMQETLGVFYDMTRTVEEDWLRTAFASANTEEELDPDTREIGRAMWIVLKTMLFTTIRITQSVLTIVVFVPQPSPARHISRTPLSTSKPSQSSPYALALTTLHTLSHLSFALPQFGGVSSTSTEGGFPELKKAFYTALDVLSADELESARFVHELRESMDPIAVRQNQTWPKRFEQAKKAYALACAEQLIRVLSEDSIREDVYPLCASHLNDSSDRETFESAHSVMLAIFSSHAQKALESSVPPGLTENHLAFAERVVPYYTQCLIDNSPPTRLNNTQLRLAFRALVRSASMMRDGDMFAWFCFSELLRAAQSPESDEHRQSMHLALIASVSAVSLAVLPRVLDTILDDVIEPVSKAQKPSEELVNALFEEISERVGDAEKEYAMTWWDAHKSRLSAAVRGGDQDGSTSKGKGIERMGETIAVSRL